MMQDVAVQIHLTDLLMAFGIFGTAFGVAGSWYNLKRDVKDLKSKVTNGLTDKVDNIEAIVMTLPCVTKECKEL
jgi:hypothetical protein